MFLFAIRLPYKKADAIASALLLRLGAFIHFAQISLESHYPFTAPLVMPLIICSWKRM